MGENRKKELTKVHLRFSVNPVSKAREVRKERGGKAGEEMKYLTWTQIALHT